MAEAPKKKETEAAIEPPAGLEDVGLPRVDGWFSAEKCKGEWVQIKLKGSFNIHDSKLNKDRTVLVCQLGTTCKAISASDKDAIVKLVKGQFLGIGLSFDLQSLAEYKDGSVFWLRADEKASIGSGRTMWRFTKKKERGEKKSADELARERVRAPASTGAGADESDDIPF